MSEFGPGAPDFSGRQSLKRFESDLYYAASFYDLYNAFSTYLKTQFGVSEEAAMELYSAMSSERLPDAELYEQDADLAREQMRLGLMRAALPIAENMIEDETTFRDWLNDAAYIAMGEAYGPHEVSKCVAMPGGSTGLACVKRQNCPVKVVKHTLIIDAMSPDYQALDYTEPWAYKKAERTLSKLTVAEQIGLVGGHEAEALRKSYLLRGRAHGIYLPENGDI